MLTLFNPPRRTRSRRGSRGRTAQRMAALRKARAALAKMRRGRKPRKSRKARSRRRTPKMARTRRRRSHSRRRTRRNPQTRKQRAAALRNLAKGRSKRRRSRGGKRRATRSRGGRRRTRRTRRSARFGLHRPRVYRTRGGWRSRGMLHGVRVNPPLMPSLGSVKGIVKNGAFGVAGWVGVNAVMMVVNKTGILGWVESQSPTVQAFARTALRVLAVPVVAKLGGFVTRDSGARNALVLGASVNAVFHGVKDIAGASNALPAWGNDLLLGGTGDFLTMGDYVTGFGADARPVLRSGPAASTPENALIDSSLASSFA